MKPGDKVSVYRYFTGSFIGVFVGYDQDPFFRSRNNYLVRVTNRKHNYYSCGDIVSVPATDVSPRG